MAVMECARITVDPKAAALFEAAVARCIPLFRDARGCLSMALEQEIENPGHYMLRVGWRSVDDHVVGFRETAAFGQWRSAVGGFLTEPPVVVHHAVVVAGF